MQEKGQGNCPLGHHMVTILSYLNGILNIPSTTDNCMGFGIREDLDLNLATFQETKRKLLGSEPQFLYL